MTAVTTSGAYLGQCPTGQGVFAASQFRAGDEIMLVTGRTLDIGDLDAEAWMAFQDDVYPYQISPTRFLYADGPAAFINHSCQPNCGVRPDMVIVALQPVAAGTHLTIDYSTIMAEDVWTMCGCECRAQECRRIVRDFRYLPRAVQLRYLEAGVVPAFVRECSNALAGPSA
jgi:hypothetical protein